MARCGNEWDPDDWQACWAGFCCYPPPLSRSLFLYLFSRFSQVLRLFYSSSLVTRKVVSFLISLLDFFPDLSFVSPYRSFSVSLPDFLNLRLRSQRTCTIEELLKSYVNARRENSPFNPKLVLCLDSDLIPDSAYTKLSRGNRDETERKDGAAF